LLLFEKFAIFLFQLDLSLLVCFLCVSGVFDLQIGFSALRISVMLISWIHLWFLTIAHLLALYFLLTI